MLYSMTPGPENEELELLEMPAGKTHPIHVGRAQAPAVEFSFSHQLLLYSNFLAVTERAKQRKNKCIWRELKL